MPTPEIPPLATDSDYTQLIGPVPVGLSVNSLLAAASDLIRTYCGWHIAPAVDETVTVDGSGTGLIILPTLQLNAVTSVTADGSSIETTDITWSKSGMIARRGSCWPSGFRSIAAAVNHGHVVPPAALVALACSIAARATVSPDGAGSAQVGSVSEAYSSPGGTTLLDHEQAYLDRHRLPPRP